MTQENLSFSYVCPKIFVNQASELLVAAIKL